MHPDALPTPRSMLGSRFLRLVVWCKSCRHQADADLQALVDSGRGDVPLKDLRFRCTNCRSRLTDWVVTGGGGEVKARPAVRRLTVASPW